jgi:hypothetical protein
MFDRCVLYSMQFFYSLIDVRNEGLHPDFRCFEVHEQVDEIKTGSLFPERRTDQATQGLKSVDNSRKVAICHCCLLFISFKLERKTAFSSEEKLLCNMQMFVFFQKDSLSQRNTFPHNYS